VELAVQQIDNKSKKVEFGLRERQSRTEKKSQKKSSFDISTTRVKTSTSSYEETAD